MTNYFKNSTLLPTLLLFAIIILFLTASSQSTPSASNLEAGWRIDLDVEAGYEEDKTPEGVMPVLQPTKCGQGYFERVQEVKDWQAASKQARANWNAQNR